MLARPPFLSGTPSFGEDTMDVLSDVLRVVQLKGAVFLDGTFAAPWSVISRAESSICSSYLPGAQRALSFHFITEGSCWALLPDDPAGVLRLNAGDILVVPQGETHILCSATDLDPVPSAPLLEEHVRKAPGEVLSLQYGGDGATTHMVCGFLASDGVLDNPLLSALPRIFKVEMRDSDGTWVESSLRFAANETVLSRPGSATVLGKLSELMFIEALRRYIETLPDHQKGWLAGLRDRFVGRALMQLHARPAYPWTIEALGREVGMSRSALAQRFADLLGQPPMQYLAHWRLHMAARQLQNSDLPVAVIAEEVGYESEAAFNRAFKREFGAPPATWRRSTAGGS